MHIIECLHKKSLKKLTHKVIEAIIVSTKNKRGK